MTDISVPAGQWTDADTIAAAERTLARLKALCVAIPKNDRLTRALAIIRRQRPTPGNQPASYDASRELTEATRTIVEFSFIASQLVARPELLELAAIALEGADIPENDSPDYSKPRDTQVELLVWAMFRAAKIPASIAEPDVVVKTPFGDQGIAVKRSSGKSARGLIKKGISQIDRHTGIGFVAVAADRRMTEAEKADPFTAFTQEIDADLEAETGRIKSGAHSSSVLAVILVGTSYRWVDGGAGPLCVVVAHLRVQPNPSPMVDENLLQSFFRDVAKAFTVALATPPKASA